MVKFCMYCGTQINEGEKICSNCGASLEEIEEENPIKNNENTNINNIQNKTIEGKEGTNGFAIASLVCSICGIIIFALFLGIAAISFSVTAKKQLKVYKNQEGSGLATAGLIIGIIEVVLGILNIFLKLTSLR